MEINPVHISIGRLFLVQHIFRVPKYQRSYAWTEEEIEDFLDDIMKSHNARVSGFRKHHFFGGIVSIEKTIDGSARPQCELVDGQQRISSFIILIACIIRHLNILKAQTINDPANEDLAKNRIRMLEEKFLIYEGEINRRFTIIDRLEMSEPDKYYFKELVKGNNPQIERDSHNRLECAYRIILNRIKLLLDPLQTIAEKLDYLKKFEEILDDDCTVIHMLSRNRGDAYRLFQVLNDRGRSLTDGDLLRARTLEMLDDQHYSQQQELVEKFWDQILQDHPDDTKNFLRWYFLSAKGKKPGNTSFFDDFLDTFFPQHRNAEITYDDSNDILAQVQNIRGEIEKCRLLIDGEWPFNPTNTTSWEKDRLRLLIKELSHTHCMPLLLASCQLNQAQFSEIIQLLEVFFFKYKVVCNLHAGKMEKIYLEHSLLIRLNPQSYSVNTLRTSLRNLLSMNASDAMFRSNFTSRISYSNSASNKPLKYFLMTAEHYYRWYSDGARSKPRCMDTNRVFDFSNTTLEHIYPQNAPQSFKNQQLDELVNDIGNLTFLGPEDNNRLGNSDFDTKKTVFEQSSIKLNGEIASYQTWDTTSIDNRRNNLIEMAIKIFKV